MKKFYQTDAFKKEQKAWYKSLKEDGFKDIEDTHLPDPPLKKWHNLLFRRINLNKIIDTTAYFEATRHLLLTYKFESPIHRQIWELHSEGLSHRQIVKVINKEGFRKKVVGEIINHIKRELL